MSLTPDKKIREAYKSYANFCNANGFLPASYEQFKQKLNMMAAVIVAERIAAPITDAADHYYIAVSHRSAPNIVLDSETRSCAQCGGPVWVHAQMTDRADASKGIICDVCAPEATGKSIKQIVAEQVARLN